MHSGPGAVTAKGHRAGTDRAVSPAQTLTRLGPLLGGMGITRVSDVTGLDRIGIPVVFACRPNGRSLSVSQGKALELDAAKASAIGESIESFHAERISLPIRTASLAALSATERVIDVNGLTRQRTSTLHAGVEIPWVPGYDLLSGATAQVPYECVHTDFRAPPPPGTGHFLASTNGLACGNTREEAILHGLYEVIERDAVTVWRLRGGERLDGTRVDLATVDDPLCREALDRFDDAGIDVAVWDATSDTGLPCFCCRIAERTTDLTRLLYDAIGMGCHARREVALLRALTEAAQCRLTVITGSRDDMPRDEYAILRHPDTLRAGRGLVAAGTPQRAFHDIPTRDHATFAEDLRWTLSRLVAVGVREVVAVDLTLPAIGFPVFVVIVPWMEDLVGLEGSEERYVMKPRAQAALAEAAA
jgi:YcaO-like protein with predicted kinase domain